MAVTTNNTFNNTPMKMSVQVSLNGLSFCILNAKDNTVVEVKEVIFNERLNPIEVENKLISYFEEHLATLPLNDVIVIHANELATFVPLPLFSEKELANYLKYNNKIFASDFIAHDIITPYDIVSVYVPFMNINNLFIDKYGAFTYKHTATILVESLLKLATPSNLTQLYANISNNHFELIAIKDNELLFYNSFIYETKEDFIYYVLFTIEQLKLDTETLPLIFIGAIDEAHELYKIAYTYIRNISTLSSNFTYSSETPISNKHFTLLNAF